MAGVEPKVLVPGPGALSGQWHVHGTTIAVRGGVHGASGDTTTVSPPHWVAAMIRGPSGSGKSDLALRCLAQPLHGLFPAFVRPFGVRLVADDRTALSLEVGPAAPIIATAPAAIAGLLEVRGLGIIAVPHIDAARLVLIVDLVAPADVQRLPSHEVGLVDAAASVAVLPRLLIAPFHASSPVKLLLALVRTALTSSPVGADAVKHHRLPEGQ